MLLVCVLLASLFDLCEKKVAEEKLRLVLKKQVTKSFDFVPLPITMSWINVPICFSRLVGPSAIIFHCENVCMPGTNRNIFASCPNCLKIGVIGRPKTSVCRPTKKRLAEI